MLGWNNGIQTWFASIVYPRFLANIFDTEIFVAKITTAITKASGIILDIQEKEGTLIGGSLYRNENQGISQWWEVIKNGCAFLRQLRKVPFSFALWIPFFSKTRNCFVTLSPVYSLSRFIRDMGGIFCTCLTRNKNLTLWVFLLK